VRPGSDVTEGQQPCADRTPVPRFELSPAMPTPETEAFRLCRTTQGGTLLVPGEKMRRDEVLTRGGDG